MVSLLDIIGPVMVGPSSSHTAGACRLGLLARGLIGGTPEDVARVEASHTGRYLKPMLKKPEQRRKAG